MGGLLRPASPMGPPGGKPSQSCLQGGIRAFHKAMAQDAVQLSQMTGTKGWVAGLSKALQAAGYAFQPQHLHSIDIRQLQSLLRGGRQRIWDDLGISPRTAPSQGARKCTYARWFRKPFWAGTSPLTLPLTHAAMQRLLRLWGVMVYQRILAASLACLDLRGCASSVALVSAVRCTSSLSAQRWQICVANFQIFSGTSDYAEIHVAAKSVAGCQIPRCRHEKIADG